MNIDLFTQPNCPFCDIMKQMLNETGYTYNTINIKENESALKFIKDQGHKTVPQLYVGQVHINKKVNTQDYTSEELRELIQEALDNSWPWSDSGIEQEI